MLETNLTTSGGGTNINGKISRHTARMDISPKSGEIRLSTFVLCNTVVCSSTEDRLLLAESQHDDPEAKHPKQSLMIRSNQVHEHPGPIGGYKEDGKKEGCTTSL